MSFILIWGHDPVEVTEQELLERLGIKVGLIDPASHRLRLTNVHAPYPVQLADETKVPFSISRVMDPGDLITLGDILIRYTRDRKGRRHRIAAVKQRVA